MTKRKALIILTSHDKLGESGKPTGFFFDEMATPYWALRDTGIAVDIASIAGGKAPVDPSSLEGEAAKPPAVQRFLQDADAMAQIENTIPLASVIPAAYDAVFLAGGHGTMWDFRQTGLAGVVGEAWKNGAVIAAVCHGPAGLIDAKAEDGTPLVRGKRVAGFTNEEEDAVKLSHIVPYSLEDELKKQGALVEKAAPFVAHAVRDGRLISGQNPQSAEAVGKHLAAALADPSARAA
ncbi:MAG: type 1 glutamine amidotransferase domain-containing protein [Beijerinckiaceae bacterium]